MKEDRTGLLGGGAFAEFGVGSTVMAIAIPFWSSRDRPLRSPKALLTS